MGAALLAVLIAPAEMSNAVPLGCGITWTRTGGVWTYLPDCSHPTPPPRGGPPTGPETPPPDPPPAP
ncbi:hypothetical protein [Mycobacterium saskatchewanense]|uniref:hypothetical protein n=1 Tax=Mycobacterium saskatchewanense TaxID=220927 RepID=UPI0013D79C66|nr:hypothetical protein [Mycobacterium saskatchewanense]